LTNGNALAGRLAKAAMNLNIPVWLSSPVKKLIFDGERVSGVTVIKDGSPIEIFVKRGVVLACGGFPFDIERRKKLFPHAPTGHEHFTPSPESNTGDGLRLGESVGGWVDPTIPNAAAWCPTSVTKRGDGTVGVMPHFIDRAKPGVIAVTSEGRRFGNEALSYHDFVQNLVKACEGNGDVTCWIVCDHAHLREYGMGAVAPFPLPIGKHLRSGYLKRGRSIEELANVIGVPQDALREEIETFNLDAISGVDTKFGKGSTAYNRYQGDSLVTPNPCMAPIKNGPFYAIKLVVGEIGTFAGLATDANCQVLTKDKQTIKGLYAVGNDAASIMGGNYPGAGITLGPALTFGYVVGQTLARNSV
jgi:succinate dehydrogenase/fumarate reductase flavoprotein subunit